MSEHIHIIETLNLGTLKALERLGLYQPNYYHHNRFERLARQCESPIESIFWSVAYFKLSELGEFTPQVRVGPHRLDFALRSNGLDLAIELDGQDYHSSPDQRTNDARRQRYLEQIGWRIIRFTGREIYKDVQKCVAEVIWFMEALLKARNR